MKSFLVLCGLVAVCSGQYSYNAPSGGSLGGNTLRAGSFGGSLGGGSIGGSIGGGSLGGSLGGGSLGGSLGGGSLGGSLGGGSFGGASFGGSSIGGSFGGSSAGGSFGGSSNRGSFGGSSGSVGTKQYASNFGGFSNQAPIIHKHVYVHVAPPEQEERTFKAQPQLPPPQKHYKIIFVKAPSAPAYVNPVIPLQPQNEEKTLVYVLVKRPDEQPDVVIPTAAPTQPSKPEVYFIKYKTQKDVSGGAIGGVSGLSGGISGLSGGVSGLSGGASGLSGGVSGLSGGVSGLSGGISGLSGGISGLSGGVSGGISGGVSGGISGGVSGGSSDANIVDSFARSGAPAAKYGTPAFQ